VSRAVTDEEHACALAGGFTVRETGERYEVRQHGEPTTAPTFRTRDAAWIWAAEEAYHGADARGQK